MAPSTLPITSLYAGVLFTGYTFASLAVGLTRVATNKFFGAEHGSVLEFRSRAAGTIGEYGSVGVLLLALLEYNKLLGTDALRWWAFVFVTARFLHALQLAYAKTLPMLFRASSFLLTIGLLGFASVKVLNFGLASA